MLWVILSHSFRVVVDLAKTGCLDFVFLQGRMVKPKD